MRLNSTFEKTNESTPASASNTSTGRAALDPARVCIASTTPAKPSISPVALRAVSGSRSSHGATSARMSGFVLATIEPIPADMCRKAS